MTRSDKKPLDQERCEPRVQICREGEKALPNSRGQGIRKDQRGQEQPADKKRAQRNR